MGSRMGAFLLSRLHAKGAGVAFSPALADHYARVAVRSWSAAEYRDVLTGPELAAGEFPADGIIDQQLAEAEAWLAAQEAAPLRARHRTVKRHLAGGAGPRSQMLVETLYRDLAYAASDKPETADITLAFVRHRLRMGPEMLAVGWANLMRKRTLSTLYYIADYQNYVPAQSLLGDLYAEAEVLPKSPAAAALWYGRAEAGGADTGAATATQLAELPDTLKRLVTRAMDISYTPWLVTEPDDIKKLHRFLEEHFARSE
jgi:TPR repeat protein